MPPQGRIVGSKDLKPRRLRPTRPERERFDEHVNKTPTCWIWTGATNDKGYGLFSVRRGRDDWRYQLAHRVAARLAGAAIDGLAVCHRCDNPTCVRPDHLFVGSQSENVSDMDRKGRRGALRGSKHGRARLTEFQVQEIRRRRADGERGVDLAREFGVSPSTIVSAVAGRNWSHVQPDACPPVA